MIMRPSGDTLGVWHRNSRDSAVVERIREDMIRLLSLPEDIKLEYTQFFPDKPA
jgi:hypothetical protein